MKPLNIEVVSSFFDEIQEEGLTPFDGNPNTRLPHSQQKVYRIKDLFKVTYCDKVCIYKEHEIEKCRIKFHMIFADNRINVFQAHGEDDRLKMMSDGDHFFVSTLSSREASNKTQVNDTNSDITKNTVKLTGKTGQLTGSVDAIQLGTVLDESQRVVNTDKLPNFFDENVRAYNQGVNVDTRENEETHETTTTYSSNTSTAGSFNSNTKRGIEAMNQYRAHSLNVRRIREEFIQCFNVLYW